MGCRAVTASTWGQVSPPAIFDVRILGAQHLILAAIFGYQDQSRLNLGRERGDMVDSRGDVSAQNQQQFRPFDRVILNQKLRDPYQDGTPKRIEKKTYQKRKVLSTPQESRR